jgi:hypothetical protein
MHSFLPNTPKWQHFLSIGTTATPSLLHGRQVRDTWRLEDGTAITLRAARSSDGALIQELVQGAN